MKLLNLFLISIFICFTTACTKDVAPPLIHGEPITGTPPTPDPGDTDPDPTTPIITKIFDNADLIDGWEQTGTNSLYTDSKEGAASVKFTITSGLDLRMQKQLTRPIVTQLTKETAQLNFWLWIENVSKLDMSTGQIEITSSGGPDVNEFNWSTASLSLKDGWNEVKLKVSQAGASGDGGADLDAINFFRMYFKLKEATTTPFSVALDDIKFVEAEVITDPVDNMLLDACDDITGWNRGTAAELSLNTLDKQEGTGSLSFIFKDRPGSPGTPTSTAEGGSSALEFKKEFATPLNPEITIEDGKFTFWLWVADVSEIDWAATNSQIELSSSGRADMNEIHWFPSQIENPKNGWNKVELKLSEGAEQGGTVDLTNINFFRMYLRATGLVSEENPLTIGADHLKFEKE
ncbi:hypothetical protein [Sphingobacterium haloxyli]|nr:hypothetical protein [Sphingobacterium haloxyli]